MYASWAVPELNRIATRYAEMLLSVLTVSPFEVLCDAHTRSLSSILQNIAEARATGDWKPFNQAAINLEWDLDELIQVMPGDDDAIHVRNPEEDLISELCGPGISESLFAGLLLESPAVG